MREGRSPVFVTRRTVLIGLGTSIAPVRFGVPPEIVVVELGDQNAER
jgi:predicted MPP superfamily phosphohydrolase